MLMDLFYQTLPPSITRKRRVHFHAFMIDAHKRIHAAKMAMGHSGGDPIAPVARDLAKEAYVLCFDEFQVTDIADAMILRRLLEGLMNHGVVCVITSKCASRFAWLYFKTDCHTVDIQTIFTRMEFNAQVLYPP